MIESGFKLITVSPRDKALEKIWSHARHIMEKRARFTTFLFLRMMGRL